MCDAFVFSSTNCVEVFEKYQIQKVLRDLKEINVHASNHIAIAELTVGKVVQEF